MIFKKKNLDHLEGGFPGGTVVENLPANAGHAEDMGSVPGSGRSPGEGKGSPFQYSCLENLMDGGAWQTAIQGVANSQTQLSDWACAHTHTHTHACASHGSTHWHLAGITPLKPPGQLSPLRQTRCGVPSTSDLADGRKIWSCFGKLFSCFL